MADVPLAVTESCKIYGFCHCLAQNTYSFRFVNLILKSRERTRRTNSTLGAPFTVDIANSNVTSFHAAQEAAIFLTTDKRSTDQPLERAHPYCMHSYFREDMTCTLKNKVSKRGFSQPCNRGTIRNFKQLLQETIFFT